MAGYAAFLRGVSPMNLAMPDLARVLSDCGLGNARTLLSSGNAVFDARRAKRATLETRIETALRTSLGRTFTTFIRASDELQQILALSAFPHPPDTKPIVVFHRDPAAAHTLLARQASWALVHATGTEAYGYYTPGPKASGLMTLLQRQLGPAFTTRTVDTVRKCSMA